MQLPDVPGTYILWLLCRRRGSCKIGRLGNMSLQVGYYAYVGSALGPGGLAARLRHHLKHSANPRWHIDHLRQRLAIHTIWFTCSNKRYEHLWAASLTRLPTFHHPMRGFGSSDCHCPSHLFFIPEIPTLEAGLDILGIEGVTALQAACTGIE